MRGACDVCEREAASTEALTSPGFDPGTVQIPDRAAFAHMRASCIADPGAFHGAIAKRRLCWLVERIGEVGAWVYFDDDAHGWRGWDAVTGAAILPDLPESFEPWDRAFNDDDPPNWRWFEGGLTSTAFNEVDRHVLSGHGA